MHKATQVAFRSISYYCMGMEGPLDTPTVDVMEAAHSVLASLPAECATLVTGCSHLLAAGKEGGNIACRQKGIQKLDHHRMTFSIVSIWRQAWKSRHNELSYG